MRARVRVCVCVCVCVCVFVLLLTLMKFGGTLVNAEVAVPAPVGDALLGSTMKVLGRRGKPLLELPG